MLRGKVCEKTCLLYERKGESHLGFWRGLTGLWRLVTLVYPSRFSDLPLQSSPTAIPRHSGICVTASLPMPLLYMDNIAPSRLWQRPTTLADWLAHSAEDENWDVTSSSRSAPHAINSHMIVNTALWEVLPGKMWGQNHGLPMYGSSSVGLNGSSSFFVQRTRKRARLARTWRVQHLRDKQIPKPI